MPSPRSKWLVPAAIATVGLIAASGWTPYDRLTWFMEVLPVLIALPVLWLTYRRFPLTSLLYVCIFVHAAVLMLGALALMSAVVVQTLPKTPARDTASVPQVRDVLPRLVALV